MTEQKNYFYIIYCFIEKSFELWDKILLFLEHSMYSNS